MAVIKKICAIHGELFKEDVSARGFSKKGFQIWNCKHCEKVKRANYYKNNKEVVNAWNMTWRENNLERYKETYRKKAIKRREKATDTYIRMMLVRKGWAKENVTPALIDLFRARLLLKRQIKQAIKQQEESENERCTDQERE